MSITTIKNFKSSQISISKEEQKRSKTGFKYNSIPIFYDEGALDLLVKGRLRIFLNMIKTIALASMLMKLISPALNPLKQK